VKRTVVSRSGKEAVVGLLGPGDFFGEWCLSERPVCIATATAMEPTTILAIGKEEMLRALHTEHALSDGFISYLLARTARIEEKLIDHLFDTTEKRLARALLRLARFSQQDGLETRIPKLSQETLAEMVGTTRSRVSFFMNRFRKLGFIHYAGGTEGALQVHSSLLNVVLHD